MAGCVRKCHSKSVMTTYKEYLWKKSNFVFAWHFTFCFNISKDSNQWMILLQIMAKILNFLHKWLANSSSMYELHDPRGLVIISSGHVISVFTDYWDCDHPNYFRHTYTSLAKNLYKNIIYMLLHRNIRTDKQILWISACQLKYLKINFYRRKCNDLEHAYKEMIKPLHSIPLEQGSFRCSTHLNHVLIWYKLRIFLIILQHAFLYNYYIAFHIIYL